jgi:hypothetical protein
MAAIKLLPAASAPPWQRSTIGLTLHPRRMWTVRASSLLKLAGLWRTRRPRSAPSHEKTSREVWELRSVFVDGTRSLWSKT